VPGLVVRRNDEVIPEEQWGKPLPLPLGYHTFTASTPGLREWRSSLVAVRGKKLQVAVPALERAEAPSPGGATAPEAVAPVERDQPKPVGKGSGRRVAAWSTGGAAVALLVVGAVCSAMSKSRADKGNALLTDPATTVTPDIAARYNSARSDATMYGGVAIGMYAAAAAAAGVSVYLFVTSRSTLRQPEEKTAKLRLVPVLGPNAAGVSAGVRF
jgi:hypothetical protein